MHRTALVLACLLGSALSWGAVYQYSVPVEPGRRAFLWIPAGCERIRGLIFDNQNLLDPALLADPVLRAAAADVRLGIVWVTVTDGAAARKSPFNGQFNYKDGAAQVVERMLVSLAKVSLHPEVEFAPLLPIGHSASGSIPWHMPYWNPSRVIAALPIKTVPMGPPKYDPQAAMGGVPVMFTVGQYSEWTDPVSPGGPSRIARGRDDVRDGLKLRANGRNLLSTVVEFGGGHFEWSDELAKLFALFIRKAAQYRLPAEIPLDRPATLKEIDPQSGWLAAAPAAQYKGDPRQAFWYFDEEMARAASRFTLERSSRKLQMVSFADDQGKPLPPGKRGPIDLPFEPTGDGLTFKVRGAFLSAIPAGIVEGGRPLGHSANGPVRVRVVAGPVVQLAPDTFRIRLDRLYRYIRPDTAWLLAWHPGDEEYSYCVYPGSVGFPLPATEGKRQRITFPKIAGVRAGTQRIRLKATSDAGLPVEYYVLFGPAEMEGNDLVLKDLPPRGKLPVEVKVVACQLGRLVEPRVQSAEPVEQAFLVNR